MNVQKYYDSLGSNYLRTFKSKGMQLLSEQEISFVKSCLPDRSDSKILEIGVGPGRIAKHIDIFKEYCGIDISPKMIEYCNKRYSSKNKIFKVHDVSNEIPFKDSYFDFVYAIRVLKYTKDWRKVIREISRITKKGGIICITIPNQRSINRFSTKFTLKYNRTYKKELIKILKINKFKIITFISISKLPDLFYNLSEKRSYLSMLFRLEQFLKILFPNQLFDRIFYVMAQKIE